MTAPGRHRPEVVRPYVRRHVPSEVGSVFVPADDLPGRPWGALVAAVLGVLLLSASLVAGAVLLGRAMAGTMVTPVTTQRPAWVVPIPTPAPGVPDPGVRPVWGR